MATSDFKKHAVKIHRVVIMVCLITAIYIRNGGQEHLVFVPRSVLIITRSTVELKSTFDSPEATANY